MSSYRTFLPGETLTDDELQDLGLQDTFTPALEASSVNPTLGTGAITNGDYLLSQGFVTVGFTIQFGTSGAAAGTGTYSVPLPAGFGCDVDWLNRTVGTGVARDSGVATHMLIVRMSSSDDEVIFQTAASPSSTVGATVPFTWGNNDQLIGSFTYKTDFT